MLRVFVALLAVVALLLALFAWDYHSEDNEQLDAARQRVADPFLESSLGLTRYRILGKPHNPTIVLIHSFNGFIESWEPNAMVLANAGYRVVAYDLWGRGLSSRPDEPLDLSRFRHQLDHLIQHVHAATVTLVGSSFGCVIATDYALHHPDRVESLALLGPAGWPNEGDRTGKLVAIPLLSDFIFHYRGESILKEKVEAYLIDPAAHAWAVQQWEKYAALPGFTRAALSTLRHSPVLDYTEGWRDLGHTDIPVLFVWGKQDVSFPYSHTARAAELILQAEIMGIDNAAHWVNIEQSDQTNRALLGFLSSPEDSTSH